MKEIESNFCVNIYVFSSLLKWLKSNFGRFHSLFVFQTDNLVAPEFYI